MAIADTLMSGVREARHDAEHGGLVTVDIATRLVYGLRLQIPSLRTDHGAKQLEQTIEKLGRTQQVTKEELVVLKQAAATDPARISAPEAPRPVSTVPHQAHRPAPVAVAAKAAPAPAAKVVEPLKKPLPEPNHGANKKAGGDRKKS